MTGTLPSGLELFDVRRLRLAEGEGPVLSAELEAARDRVWEMAVAANPTLFDGPVVGCVELRWEEPDTLFLRWAAVTYRHYALRRVPDGKALPSLFVNAIQPTDDGRIVVGRMSPATAAPGRWQLPGGSVEPPETGGVLDEDAMRGQAARELAEEVGVELKPDELRLWVATRGRNSSVGLTYLAPALPEAELRERFGAVVAAERSAGREPEFSEIVFVRSPEELAGLAGPHADYVEPVLRRYAGTPLRPGA
ncbi:NUDIX hydrolase [Streptomyces palmae]|uniref:NUDIX hydrolase n=1 Tax=Streptomyces palmae TaxID=1701085 RepID=UPI001FD73386|nr:NUDIX domain-containing protein [Streptomyces palmae]